MAKEIGLWMLEMLAKAGRGILSFIKWIIGHMRLGLAGIPKAWWLRVLVALPLVFFLYILGGMIWLHRIDDSFTLSQNAPEKGSVSVAITERLINRETRENAWLVNDPAFQPGWWLDNTPNFQRGIMGAASRFVIEVRDHLGRTRGSSAVDADLERSAGNLSREMDRWIVDFSTSLLPTTASDTYFREGADNLATYNARLARGEAVFDRRADNLMATLDRIALDLGASSAALDDYIRNNAGGFGPDFGSDDLFYQVKGQVYAYSYILIGLRADFDKVITDKDLAPLYDDLLASLQEAAALHPGIVMNGSVDGSLANHLSMLGFYLLRARTQLREVTSILMT